MARIAVNDLGTQEIETVIEAEARWYSFITFSKQRREYQVIFSGQMVYLIKIER